MYSIHRLEVRQGDLNGLKPEPENHIPGNSGAVSPHGRAAGQTPGAVHRWRLTQTWEISAAPTLYVGTLRSLSLTLTYRTQLISINNHVFKPELIFTVGCHEQH